MKNELHSFHCCSSLRLWGGSTDLMALMGSWVWPPPTLKEMLLSAGKKIRKKDVGAQKSWQHALPEYLCSYTIVLLPSLLREDTYYKHNHLPVFFLLKSCDVPQKSFTPLLTKNLWYCFASEPRQCVCVWFLDLLWALEPSLVLSTPTVWRVTVPTTGSQQ